MLDLSTTEELLAISSGSFAATPNSFTGLGDLTIDFIEGLPLSKGMNYILIVVDRWSKYDHFIGLRHPFTATSVAEAFIRVLCLHRFPASIVFDRDKIFLSHLWLELFTLHGIDLKRSTSYHPKTDRQPEIVNNGVETYLRCFVTGKASTWAQWFPWTEFSYNTFTHLST